MSVCTLKWCHAAQHMSPIPVDIVQVGISIVIIHYHCHYYIERIASRHAPCQSHP